MALDHQEEQNPASLESILKSELYPKKTLQADEKSLVVPFPILCGESVEYLGRTSDGVVALSNYRLFIRFSSSFVNIPVGLIEGIECRDIFYLHVYCKDARSLRCTFSTNEACLEWYKRLLPAIGLPKKVQNVFAFPFYAWAEDGDKINGSELDQPDRFNNPLTQPGEHYMYSFGKEVERLGFSLGKAWRISSVNDNFSVCPTYPKEHIVPASILDKDLEKVAGFRSSRRFPSVVWRDQRSGAVIARCSQPEVGWLGWRNQQDENMIQAISAACAIDNGSAVSPSKHCNGSATYAHGEPNGEIRPENNQPELKKMLIVDARSYTAAVANRAKGGGCECQEYYPNCEIQFMNLANIHTIRKSFHAVRLLCGPSVDQASWFSSLENTKWLQHIGGVLRAASIVVNAIDKETRPVLVHCSDGWDRTPQITALAEMMLDPYYRTVEGFQAVVQREWLEFGHKFADRCGLGVCTDDINERCPVFLQFLDCVYQLLKQFPTAFEFNETFLIKLAHHTYSLLFGTFLCNNVQERLQEQVPKQTASVWGLLGCGDKHFRNYLFSPTEQVLRPSCQMKHLHFWTSIYLSHTATTGGAEKSMSESMTSDDLVDGANHSEQTLLPKTRSCDDLVAAVDQTPTTNRRLSDPNIGTDPNILLRSTANGHSGADPGETRALIQVPSLEDLAKVKCDAKLNLVINGVTDNCIGKEQTMTPMQNSIESDDNVHKPMCNGVIQCNGNDCDVKQDVNGETTSSDSEEEEVTASESACTLTPDCDDASAKGSNDTLSGQGQTTIGATAIPDCPGLSVESSTDTLTGEHDPQMTNNTETSLHKKLTNGVASPTSKTANSSSSLGHNLVMKKSSISTSTSDISDSNVCGHFSIEKLQSQLQSHLKLDEESLTLQIPNEIGSFGVLKNGHGYESQSSSHTSSKTSSSGNGSEISTPLQSRTPNSTSPPTPSADGKASNPWSKAGNRIARHLDSDGLTMFADPAQKRLVQMETEYQRKIEALEKQLRGTLVTLYRYTSGCNGAGRHFTGEELELNDSYREDSEHASLGGASTAASDISWEQVDEKDSKIILWVPDHAVTHCALCSGAFGCIIRKHHCRNCGKVFCHECSKYEIPIPQQQLHDPARVCNRCYRLLRTDSSLSNGEPHCEELDGQFPTPVLESSFLENTETVE